MTTLVCRIAVVFEGEIAGMVDAEGAGVDRCRLGHLRHLEPAAGGSRGRALRGDQRRAVPHAGCRDHHPRRLPGNFALRLHPPGIGDHHLVGGLQHASGRSGCPGAAVRERGEGLSPTGCDNEDKEVQS